MRTRIVVPVAAVGAAAAVLGAVALASGSASSGAQSAQIPGENRALFAIMNGRKEVDAEGNRRVGDLDGRGTFSATVDGTELCYGITVKNIDAPVAAHIHKARANQAGDIVVPLTHPTSGDPGTSSDCATVDAVLLAAILKNPAKYYVNVHTGPFPGGAVRGQLFGRSTR